jgi:hypothetical protein
VTQPSCPWLLIVEVWKLLAPDVLDPIIQDLVIPEISADNQEFFDVLPQTRLAKLSGELKRWPI